MLKYELFLFTLLSTIFSARAVPDCSDLTVGLCSPVEEEVVDVYDLGGVDDGVGVCQEICQIQEDCSVFLFSDSDSLCTLLHYSYLHSCQVVGGGAGTELEECMEHSRDCDNLLQEEDCEYTGDLVLRKTSITNTHSCQDLLTILGPVYDAQYFVFDNSKSECSLYSTKNRSCTKTSGPVVPSIKDCETPTKPALSTLVMNSYDLCDPRGDPCGNITEATFQLVTDGKTCTDTVAPLQYQPPNNILMDLVFTITPVSSHQDSLMACHLPFAAVDVPAFVTNDSLCFVYDRIRREW